MGWLLRASEPDTVKILVSLTQGIPYEPVLEVWGHTPAFQRRTVTSFCSVQTNDLMCPQAENIALDGKNHVLAEMCQLLFNITAKTCSTSNVYI